ncbi:hypothetical protein EJ06DRAFT_543321 [Trichodelitschia bisporula]|uniref:Microbial-type PARG catalytic domain-containing protein n=1 Tax=Trichodelitschia bisporula TaxID=703511 RepID=A0A6G1HV67_9PEZI|nr:hypothetical protein EJ06DRAFT_543321 [Trichodelitschia bisporula]
MPQAKPKPSEIAAEAKRVYIPWINSTMGDSSRSVLYPDSNCITVPQMQRSGSHPRIAVMEGDAVDVALGWYQYSVQNVSEGTPVQRVPVVNMANEKRPGGDWESGLMAPEECFARRSNLVSALPTSLYGYASSHYPIPQTGGIYSPRVVVFRDGPDQYEIWREPKELPVISVAPVRRPKLDETGTKYSFEQEKELMKEKMKTILRIAAYCKHKEICIGAFGIGPVFRNPVREVAHMWKELLFATEEFLGAFNDVVFAIDISQSSSSKTAASDLETFKEVFDPSQIFHTSYR